MQSADEPKADFCCGEEDADEDDDDESQTTNRSVLRVVSNSTYHDAMIVCAAYLLQQ